MFVETANPLPMGTEVMLRFSIPNAEMLEDGRARYPNAPKAERHPWDPEPEKQGDIEDFFGKRKR